MFQALRELANDDPTAAPSPFSGRARKALLGFLATIEELLTARHQIDLPDLFDMILERVGLRAALLAEYGEDEGEERWANVQELRGVATEYTGLRREAQLATFLEEVSLVSDIDTLDRQTNVVTCITLHQAKGLEYPVVFLIGLEDGLLPHRHALNDIDNRAERLEEERRLFYVGATRAQQRLYLLYAFRRVLNGRMNVSTPSMFLKSIPRDLMEQPIKRQTTTPQRGMLAALLEHPAPPEQQLPDIAFSDNTSTQRKPAAAPDEISFFPGQRVFHQRFGEGEVISSKLTEDDEEVIVRFASGTEKRLLASFARLQAID
jgi:DNA helicase-2/ATP-dependent DNA helicase PcrA